MIDSENLILSEMKLSGLIKDGDFIEWVAPNREFIFKLSRYDNQLWASNEGQFKSLIELNIISMIGVSLVSIKFTEVEAFNICDCLSIYVAAYLNNDLHEDSCIGIDSSDFNMDSYMISLAVDNTIQQYSLDKDGINRDILFQLNKYSHSSESVMNILTMHLSFRELDALAYDIYFVGLLDQDMPYPMSEQVDYLYEDIVYRNRLNS